MASGQFRKSRLFQPSSTSVIAACFLIVTVLLSFRLFRPIALTHKSLLSGGPICIRMHNGDSKEGIGAIVKRYELGFAAAEVYNAHIELPLKPSEHGYNISDMFASCNAPSDCEIQQRELIIDTCERGDCECISSTIRQSLHHIVRKCNVLSIYADGARHMEFSGCYNKTLSKYFDTNDRLLTMPYAAIHYRQGDLKWQNGGKSLSQFELKVLIHFLCSATPLNIIVVTEGQAEAPICPNRTYIANDSSILESMNIFRYAHTVALSTSSFSRLIAQRTHARRFVVSERSLGLYTWASGVKWSVYSKDGSMHHYSSTQVRAASAQPGGWISESYFVKQPKITMPVDSIGESWRKLL